MPKKSLSDLLKEEAGKADKPGEAPEPSVPSDETPAAPGDDPAPQPAQNRRKTAASRASTKTTTRAAKGTGSATKPATKPAAKAPQTAAAQPASVTETSPSPDADADTLAELEATLAAVQQEKVDLEQAVQGLQQDIAAQQSRLFELTDSLDQAKAEAEAKTKALQQTEADLAEAKATILKLSAPPEKTAAPTAAPATTRSLAPARRSGGDIVPRHPITGPAQPGYVRGVPTYSPQTEQPNPMLSDADIGWVD